MVSVRAPLGLQAQDARQSAQEASLPRAHCVGSVIQKHRRASVRPNLTERNVRPAGMVSQPPLGATLQTNSVPAASSVLEIPSAVVMEIALQGAFACVRLLMSLAISGAKLTVDRQVWCAKRSSVRRRACGDQIANSCA